MTAAAPVTRSQLVADLQRLGVIRGGVLMVHTRMSALGWVVGGSETVVAALLEALGPDGTLMAYAGWDDDSFDLDRWPAEHRHAYEADPPAYDPAISEAARDHGRIPERIRTWPGACRSRHPEANIVAIGPRADGITADHPWDNAYGPGSPLAKLVEADGQVLMLGAPLDTLTLLHHAEATANVPNKRRVTYRMPLSHNGQIVWREFHDIDTSHGAFPYEQVHTEIARTVGMQPGDAEFAAIARQALAAGVGRQTYVGQGESALFPAGPLHAFAVAWMERHFARTITPWRNDG